MGQHTWFVKDKELYLKELELWDEAKVLCEDSENDIDEALFSLHNDLDVISKKNAAKYHDVFRTSKRTEKGCYIEEIITSRDECFEWIEKPENYTYFSDFGNEKAKEAAIKRLEEFWQEPPNGLIYFE